MKRKQLRSLTGSLMLLVGSMIWGSAFVAQSSGMDYIGPYTFNGIRFLIGALALLPVVVIRRIYHSRKSPASEQSAQLTPKEKRSRLLFTIIAGLVAGVAVFIPTTLQQIGLVETSPGKSGFITAMYIVTVPLLSLFLGKKIKLNVWASIAIAVAGLYFLCVTEQLSITRSDTITLISVFFWAVQILVIDYYAPKVDCFLLSCMEFFVAGLLSLVPMFILEEPDINAIMQCAPSLLYVGIMSCGVAYTLQPLGQKRTPPTLASILMSLESVFAVLTGYIVLGDALSPRELLGCVLMFSAVILAQIPFGSKKEEKDTSESAEAAA